MEVSMGQSKCGRRYPHLRGVVNFECGNFPEHFKNSS